MGIEYDLIFIGRKAYLPTKKYIFVYLRNDVIMHLTSNTPQSTVDVFCFRTVAVSRQRDIWAVCNRSLVPVTTDVFHEK